MILTETELSKFTLPSELSRVSRKYLQRIALLGKQSLQAFDKYSFCCDSDSVDFGLDLSCDDDNETTEKPLSNV